MSQKEHARIFAAGMESLGKSLRDIEAIVCHIDDTEVWEKLRFRPQSIPREFSLALQKLLNSAA